MGDSSLGLDDSQAVQLTGKIMMIAVLVLFIVVVFVLCLHLYAKWYWAHNATDDDPNSSTRHRRRRRFVFAPGQDAGVTPLRRGLEPSVLKSLPLVIFSSQDFKEEGLECAVCLSDLVDGEKARLLPKCNHGFHVECIDMWFQSHSTCPLCRNAVVPVTLPHSDSTASSELSVEIPSPADTLASGFSMESPNFPTNVLFWGNQTRVSSGPGSGLEEGSSGQGTSSSGETRRPEGMLVIDIPSENPMTSLASPLPNGNNNRFAEEDLKSPMTTRLRSLKRLLSRDSRRISPCSQSSSSSAAAAAAVVDVEVGRGGQQS